MSTGEEFLLTTGISISFYILNYNLSKELVYNLKKSNPRSFRSLLNQCLLFVGPFSVEYGGVVTKNKHRLSEARFLRTYNAVLLL